MSPERISVRVDSSPLRCPFCHDDVDPTSSWRACSSCLARHHTECWGESLSCAACRCESSLLPAMPVRSPVVLGPGLDSPRAARRDRERVRRKLVGALLIASVLANLVLVYLILESGVLSPFMHNVF